MAVEAVVKAVQAYSVHGTPYYRLLLALEGRDDRLNEAQLAATEVYPDPRPGDPVLVDLVPLVNLVSAVRRRE